MANVKPIPHNCCSYANSCWQKVCDGTKAFGKCLAVNFQYLLNQIGTFFTWVKNGLYSCGKSCPTCCRQYSRCFGTKCGEWGRAISKTCGQWSRYLVALAKSNPKTSWALGIGTGVAVVGGLAFYACSGKPDIEN